MEATCGHDQAQTTPGCDIRGSWTGSGREAAAVVVPVPQIITPLQAHHALRAAGLLAAVIEFIAAEPEEVQPLRPSLLSLSRHH